MRPNLMWQCVSFLAVGIPACSSAPLDVAAGAASSMTTAASGSLDPAFGAGGKVETKTIEVNGPIGAILQPDGKIVVATSFNDNNVAGVVFGVLRYGTNGHLDTTFGNGGIVRTAFTAGFNYAHDLAIAPDGKIVVVGSASTPSNTSDAFAVARYLPGGALDTTFGNGGTLTTSLLGFRDDANVVLVQSDGKIVVGGSALPCFGRTCTARTAIVRYLPNGTLDATFGTGGEVVVSAVGNVGAMALESDGSILVTNGGSQVARFTASGASAPVALVGNLAASTIYANVVFQPDGRIVVGDSAPGLGRHGRDAHVDRFTLAGTLDPSFNNPAFAYTTRFINTQTSVNAVLVQADGAILAGGTAPTPTSTNNFASAFGLARITPSGPLDATFGTGGTTTVTFSGQDNALDALLVQLDGKVVAVGTTSFTNAAGNLAFGVALARLQ